MLMFFFFGLWPLCLFLVRADTLTWTNPQTTGARPCRRRAHTTCVYNNHIYIFGGGDGIRALNDTHALDLATMHWTEIKTTGTIPLSRGYHTSNLINSKYIVFGGSDGHECFSDIHVLDLGKRGGCSCLETAKIRTTYNAASMLLSMSSLSLLGARYRYGKVDKGRSQ